MNWRLSTTLRVQRTLCIAFLAVLGFSISCDRDCPTEPPPPPPPVDNGTNFYVLYRDAGLSSEYAAIYIYNTKQMAVVDSFQIGFGPNVPDYRDIEVTSDEKYILVGTTGGPVNAFILDASTHQLAASPSSGAAVDWEVSPNGSYIVMQGGSQHLYLDAKSFDTLTFDTGAGGGGAWDSTGNIFYSIRWRTDHSVIRRFDLTSGIALPEVPYRDSAHPGSYVVGVQPTADPNKVFLYIYFGQNSGRIVSYNLADSSIGFSYWIASQNTELAITNDWKTILFTDPVNWDNYLAERNVYMVDAATDQLETIIPPPPPPYFVPGGNPAINPHVIAISPDGKYAMMDSPFIPESMGLLSLWEQKYVAFFKADTNWVYSGEPMSVACRVKP